MEDHPLCREETLQQIRELEIKAAEKRLALLDNRTCRNCGSEIEPNFLRCPTCMRKLKEPCRSCGRPLDPRWRVCPYCDGTGQCADGNKLLPQGRVYQATDADCRRAGLPPWA